MKEENARLEIKLALMNADRNIAERRVEVLELDCNRLKEENNKLNSTITIIKDILKL